MKIIHKYKGFTLVELLVTISIVILLTVVSIPNFAKFKNLNELNNVAKNIQSEIYKTKSYALSPAIDKNPDTNAYQFVIEKTSDDKILLIQNEINYIDNENIIVLNNLSTNTLPNYILMSCSSGEPCFDVIFSIEKYARVSKIESQMGSDALNYNIDISSNKIDKIIKELIFNKITTQINIETSND